MKRHIAIYVRVSSKQQDTRSQEHDLRRWAEAIGDDQRVVWYTDTSTGTNMNRPDWRKLEAGIRAGKVSKLVIWRLDRLGRTVLGVTQLIEELRQHKVNLVSLKEGFDLETPAGRLMVNMLLSFAQFETECRAERQLAGIEAAKAAGKSWGGSKPGRTTNRIAERAETVCRMRADGESVTRISKLLQISRPTVYKLLAAESAVTT